MLRALYSPMVRLCFTLSGACDLRARAHLRYCTSAVRPSTSP
jgi:hypothetical protein